MSISSFARIVAAMLCVGCATGTATPAGLAPPSGCNVIKASALHAAAERLREHGNLARSARWFVAATEASQDCWSTSGMFLNAHSLVRAGALLANTGDYLHALVYLQAAQGPLTALSTDAKSAARAQSDLTDVSDLIKAINVIAGASM